MGQRDYSLSLSEGEGRGEGDMEFPPHPAPGRLGIRLANPPHPSPPDGGEGTWSGKPPLLTHPQVVITGLDPVIHTSRHGTRGWPGLGPAMTQSYYASSPQHPYGGSIESGP